MTLLPGARAITPARHDRMPYRVFLAQIGERLRHTYRRACQRLRERRTSSAPTSRSIAESLRANKGANAGLFYVRRLLRRIETFGFHLATLDVRQHASVHHQVLARGFDDPHWLDAYRAERRQLLARCARDATSGRVASSMPLGKRTLARLRGHRAGSAPLRSRSGRLLHRERRARRGRCARARCCSRAGPRPTTSVPARSPLDIAPLFESVDTLERCGETMQELLADPRLPAASRSARRRQCVLIGYSDSNKEGGTVRLALCHPPGAADAGASRSRPPANSPSCSTPAAAASRAAAAASMRW